LVRLLAGSTGSSVVQSMIVSDSLLPENGMFVHVACFHQCIHYWEIVEQLVVKLKPLVEWLISISAVE